MRRAVRAHLGVMSENTRPDLFMNVHKGIRRALFAACMALGRAGGDPTRDATARKLLAEALRFVAHHGENEDVLLLPLLEQRAPRVFAAMTGAHAALDEARAALSAEESTASLYLAACAFTSSYIAHLDEEERDLEPEIRRVLSAGEIAEFGRRIGRANRAGGQAHDARMDAPRDDPRRRSGLPGSGTGHSLERAACAGRSGDLRRLVGVRPRRAGPQCADIALAPFGGFPRRNTSGSAAEISADVAQNVSPKERTAACMLTTPSRRASAFCFASSRGKPLASMPCV